MNFLSRVLRPLFWAALLIAYTAAIMPTAYAPAISSWDKMNHMIAFFALSLLGGLAWRETSLWAIGAALALVGLAIELTQAIPMVRRDASGADLVADCIAILFGLAVAFIGRRGLPWPRT